MTETGYDTEWGESGDPASFDVVLGDTGGRKIEVIREIRTASGLGLKEAKDLTDSPPSVVLEAVDRERAERLAERLREVGASVEVVASSKPLATVESVPAAVRNGSTLGIKRALVVLVFLAVAIGLLVEAYR